MLNLLFPGEPKELVLEEPEVFKNLNMDQIVKAICVTDADKVNIPLYYTQLTNIKDIKYRQDIFIDLDNQTIYEGFFKLFTRLYSIHTAYKQNCVATASWLTVRERIRLLDSYLKAISEGEEFFKTAPVKSECLKKLGDYLTKYITREDYCELKESLKGMKAIISSIRYSMIYRGNDIIITPYDSTLDIDYSNTVNDIFNSFEWESTQSFVKENNYITDSKHVDEAILECLSQTFKPEFKGLETFAKRYQNFFDEALFKLASDARFYITYKGFMEKLKKNDLSFSIPEMISDYQETSTDSFDMALAYKLNNRRGALVTNSYSLLNNERVIILSGPNQGGKTTFARQMGQLHWFASLGVPVAGRNNKIHLTDRIYTHFKTEENLDNLSGKLQIELLGLKDIFSTATKDSFIILNEIFASTTALDGHELGRALIDKMKALGNLCLFVTFLSELSDYNEITTSMVSNVLKEDPNIRTFKITKHPADGKAYAEVIADRHHLSYDDIKRRLSK